MQKENAKELQTGHLTQTPGKLMEQIMKQPICKHLEDNKMISDCRRLFVKNNLISFCNRVTGLWTGAEAGSAVYLDIH